MCDDSDVQLLELALRDAQDAVESGVIIGRAVDEVALRRAVCRAVRADVRRSVQLGLDTAVGGDAA